MKKTSNSDEPGPRKMDVYRSLQVKGILVDLALWLMLMFGPLMVVTFVAGVLFSAGRPVIVTPLTVFLAIPSCALIVPLYRLRGKLGRHLRELEEQIG